MSKLNAGDRIDGFELIEKLPSGGMASLWRARRPDDAAPVVLKIPVLDPGEDVSVIVGYEVEELILKRLSGPHVPRFIGAGDLGRIPYLAMEFVEGTSLAKIAEDAPLAADEIARIGIELATALASLHAQKVVHLDLKPQNVILAPGRGAVLLDFGLARHADLPDFLGEESSVPMGSAAYIAPEQVLGERSDPGSDIFALGCILYELSTGEEPFGWPKTVAGMRRRLFHAPDRVLARRPELPRWIDAVIARCMEVDRARRYSDAAQVAFDLRHPDQVSVRIAKNTRPGLLTRLGKAFAKRSDFDLVGKPRGQLGAGAPAIVLVAVDLALGVDPLAEEVLAATARVLASRRDSRLSCLTVLKTDLLGDTGQPTRSAYVDRLVALKDWARPLELPDHRISYHVVEAVSAADAVLAYAEHNGVSHIVIGARGSSAVRRHLGSVSTKVVAEASCSVSVVRLPRAIGT